MGVDVFLKVGDIQGESTDAKHAGEIEVVSWAWGILQTGSIAPAGGGGAGRVTFTDLSFTHTTDRASPLLMKACATGQHIKDATLVVRKAGKGQHEYLVIKMSDVTVTSVQAAGAREQLTENVSMKFALVDVEYRHQRADGSPDDGVRFTYDIENNREA
jgi:type VI secretion system secreted protein Hcp